MTTYTRTLNLLLALLFGVMVVFYATTALAAPMAGFVGNQAEFEAAERRMAEGPQNIPTYSEFSAQFPGCHQIHKISDLTDTLIVVDLNREAHKWSFDKTYAMTHDKAGNDLETDFWVVAYC